MIPGIKVNVFGTDYVVPPFNVRMWERPEVNERVEKELPAATIKRMGPVLLDNLARNYPEIEPEKIMDDLDLPTLLELQSAAMATRHEPLNPPSASVATPTGQG